MTIKKITQFIFPAGETELSQNAYYRALAEASNGFYPFGENGIWHGGIHIDNGVLRKVNRNDNKIRCIANGEVIAYRVNSVYPKVSYDFEEQKTVPLANDKEKVAYFSSGFTLVRHYFVMPKIAGETEAPPSITLYSLYMHQLDLYGYQQREDSGEEVDYPTYWHLKFGRVSDETKDRIKGVTLRENGAKTKQLAMLLKGSEVKLGKELTKNSGWYLVSSVEKGQVITVDGVQEGLSALKGYIHKSDIDGTINANAEERMTETYKINKEGNNTLGEPRQTVPGIIVYKHANGKNDENNIECYLSQKTIFDFDGQENGYAKIKKVHGDESASITGWVKIANLTSLKYEPKELDKIVMLDKPVGIKGADFIGYLGHSVSRKQPYYQYNHSPLPKKARPEDEKLNELSAQLGHIELFTRDDLPSFITKTRALADKLPDSEKTLVIVEKDAQLIREREADGRTSYSQYIKRASQFFDDRSSYTRVIFGYSLKANLLIDKKRLIELHSVQYYRLTREDKDHLVASNRFQDCTVSDIPDEVEIKRNHSTAVEPLFAGIEEVEIRFERFNGEAYWVRQTDATVLISASEGQLNQSIWYWKVFPLSLTNLPAGNLTNTVYYPRTLPLSSLQAENHIAIDDNGQYWFYITAANEECSPIKGWVNITQEGGVGLQAHVSRKSPWSWHGFEMLEEQSKPAEQLDKANRNKSMTLDLADYTESMTALHHILTKTPMSQSIPYVLPPLTAALLKEGLRTDWTAEQIGHLVVKYESEWYADESLSKWNEIDDFYEKELKAKQQEIEKELEKKNITKPVEREHVLKALTERFKFHLNEWQIEKTQRIKPSLWWSEVATAQAAQSTNTEQNTTAEANQPVLSNLPADGKV